VAHFAHNNTAAYEKNKSNKSITTKYGYGQRKKKKKAYHETTSTR